ncbi:MAG: hypothetical protein MZV63_58695 [Marinilabiliales bacterium]|nr:hypothetical protein [Marinilabiliales bacterium]
MDFRDMEKGWRTFGHQPRYMTNYVGLRNRLAILDENYNYADFRTRVAGNYNLLKVHPRLLRRPTPPSSRSSSPTPTPGPSRAGLAPAEADTFGLDIDVQPLPGKLAILGYEMEAPAEPAPGAAQAPPALPPDEADRPPQDLQRALLRRFRRQALGPPALRLPHPARRDRGPRQAPPARRRRRAPDRGRDPRGRGLPHQGDQGGRAPLPGPPDQHRQGRVRRRDAGTSRRDAPRPHGPAPGAPGRLPPRAGERRRPRWSGIFSTGTSSASGAAGPRPIRPTS